MKTKILFCIQNFDIGGPQKSLLALLYELDYNRFEIDLMIWSQKGSLIKYLPKDVNILNFPEELAYLRISKDAIVSKSITLIKKGRIDIVVNVMKYLLKYRYNINLCRQKFWERYHHIFTKIEKIYDIAIAVSGGNLCYFIIDCVTAKRKFTWVRTDYRVLNRDKSIDEQYFKLVDGIITVSKLCKEILISEFPNLDSSKICVMYNLLPLKLYDWINIDTSIIDRKNDEKILLTVCRIDPNKGLDIAINAMKRLIMNGIKVKWYILGDGKYKKTLQKIISKEGLDKEFILLGFKDNPYAFIRKCDVFVHPSRFEGKSNSVDEAKYALKPIVVTNYPTVTEQITHGVNGYISNMDEISLAEGIQEVLINSHLASYFEVNLNNEIKNISNNVLQFYNLLGI